MSGVGRNHQFEGIFRRMRALQFLHPIAAPHAKVKSNKVYLPQEMLLVSTSLPARQINAIRWTKRMERPTVAALALALVSCLAQAQSLGSPPREPTAATATVRQVVAPSNQDRQWEPWLFPDPKNLAVFTTTQVVRQRLPILHVSHDYDDGTWQFHTGASRVSSGDLMVVGLEEMVKHDPTILELADLPRGWIAERDRVGSRWRRVRR